ncbi:MAG TPA: hypothetical protein VK144_00800 [Bacillota bacterium]|nr:hypothetical protein [Bacillota bacterium]
MKKTIHIYMNNVPLQMHFGATHKHALLRLDEKLYEKVLEKKADIYDDRGNRVQMDGALEEGVSYYVQEHKTDS